VDITKLTSSDLKQIAALLKEKEALLGRVAKIDAQLNHFGTSAPAARQPARRPVKKKARGQVKEHILAALRAAGKTGVTVKELAVQLGKKPQHVHIWFYTVGKRVKGMKKLAPGRYALAE